MRRRRGSRATPAAPAGPAPGAPQPEAATRSAGPPAAPVEVRVEVASSPAEVLRWFRDQTRWLRFQGQTVRLDPRPGGELRVELGDGMVVAGRYLTVDPNEVAFTWGRPGDAVLPSESSTVTVTAEPLPADDETAAEGGERCELVLRHEGLPDEAMAAAHSSGWRYHLLRLAVAAGGATGDTETVELFLAAAGEQDDAARRGLLERTCTPDVEVADAVGTVLGLERLVAHLGRGAAAAPDRRLVRAGDVNRVGALLRCRYEVVEPAAEPPAADTAAVRAGTAADGELVAAIEGRGLIRALSFFV